MAGRGARFAVSAAYVDGAVALRLAELDAESASGARLAFESGEGIRYVSPRRGLRLDGVMQLAGGGFPDTRIELAQERAGAPLTGLADHPLATSWNRIGTMIYQHGEDFFHFEGLRSYKEKFNPVWIPQYLACRGGLSVPSVLFDISALIAGGRMDIIRK